MYAWYRDSFSGVDIKILILRSVAWLEVCRNHWLKGLDDARLRCIFNNTFFPNSCLHLQADNYNLVKAFYRSLQPKYWSKGANVTITIIVAIYAKNS